ncbi:MAG: GNAT family N-acetyltransferase [Bacteroidota bacterium]
MIQAIDNNFNQHANKIINQTDGMTVYETENLTYSDSNLSCDTFNIIHITNGLNLNQIELEKAINYFRQKQLEYCIWINEINLNSVKSMFHDLKLKNHNKEVGMVMDMKQYDPISKAGHSNIKIVEDRNQLNDFATVIAENWEPTDTNVLKYYSKTAHAYLAETTSIILLIYYQNEIPVSVVELFPSNHQIIGLYGFATKKEFRRAGIGNAMFTYALNLIKEKGYTHAILQASEDGIGIYRKYGFEERTVYYEYA